jgi:glutamine cyclotransferase
MKRLLLSLVLASMLAGACDGRVGRNAPPSNSAVSGYEIVKTYPHSREAYTQGLIFHEGKLIESTGQEGRSSVRRVDLETGDILQKVSLPFEYFGEGLTLLNGKLYQLTWQHQKGFIYDPATFQKIGEFSYHGEGWGLTQDGQFLILSDGTNRIRFIDPATFQVKRIISVTDRGAPVHQLNEMEYARGEILANVWHTDKIARIDPESGKVVGWIDLTGLLRKGEVSDEDAVLNGIAYDEATGRLVVTGKMWPKLFEIRLKQ